MSSDQANIKNQAYIYVASTPEYSKRGIYKIGSTRHLNRKIYSMSSSNIECFQYFSVTLVDIQKNFIYIEKMLHIFLKKQHYIRNFYYLSDDDIFTKIPEFIKNIQIQ